MAAHTPDHSSKLTVFLDALVERRPSLWSLSVCGLSPAGREIPALLDYDAYVASTDRARLLLLSGLSGQIADVEQTLAALDQFASMGRRYADAMALSAVPCGNPDGLAGESPNNGAGGTPSAGYPPEGGFFNDPIDPERRYLWRWICFQAPDLVLELTSGDRVRWEANQAAKRLAPAVAASDMRDDGSLLTALGKGTPAGLGAVPGLRLSAPAQRMSTELGRLWSFIPQFAPWEPSSARRTLDYRRSRTPTRVASILDSVYGHSLDPVNYTQGVAISGRLRLAALGPGIASLAQDIASVLDAAGIAGENVFGAQPSGATLAGVLWGPDLAQATGDRRWADLLLRAAEHYQSAGPGAAPPPADPDFRAEDLFMSSAVLGRAFQVTGDHRYLDLLTPFIVGCGIQHENGLFGHCRPAPFLWGRGNGFAALGLAEALTYLPQDHPDREIVLRMYSAHVEALRPLQQPSGMFPQVLDRPGSYQEFTATCMIGYAIARGLRMGWLDPAFNDVLWLCWRGISERIDDDGNVTDACASTGVQADLRSYLDRPAITGLDERSGGMALWFAVELERLVLDTA